MKIADMKMKKLESTEPIQDTESETEDKSEFEQMFGYKCDPKEAMDIMMKAHVLKKDPKMAKEIGTLAEAHKKPIKSLAQLKKVRDEKAQES